MSADYLNRVVLSTLLRSGLCLFLLKTYLQPHSLRVGMVERCQLYQCSKSKLDQERFQYERNKYIVDVHKHVGVGTYRYRYVIFAFFVAFYLINGPQKPNAL